MVATIMVVVMLHKRRQLQSRQFLQLALKYIHIHIHVNIHVNICMHICMYVDNRLVKQQTAPSSPPLRHYHLKVILRIARLNSTL